MKSKEYKYLKDLVVSLEHYIKNMDTIMELPSTSDRGKKIAEQLNSIDMQKDIAKRYGLGMSLKRKL